MRKIAISAAAVFSGVLVLLLAAVLVVESRWFSDYLSGKLSESYGRKVEWTGPLQIDWSLTPHIVIQQPRVENTEWAKQGSVASAERVAVRVDLRAIFDGLLIIEQVEVIEPDVNLFQSARHGNNWSFVVPEEAPEEPPLLEPRVKSISIIDGSVAFVAPDLETSVEVTVRAPEGEQLEIGGNGQVLGRPIMLSFTGDPPGKAATEIMTEDNVTDSYSVVGQVRWQGHVARLDGYTQAFTELGDMRLDMSLEGPDANALAQLFGYSTKEAPYYVSASVRHRNEQVSLTELQGALGESKLDGRMTLDLGGERPQLAIELDMSELNVSETLPFLSDSQNTEKTEDEQQPWRQTVEQRLALLQDFDADIDLHLGSLVLGETRLRDITALAQLEAGMLQVEQVSVAADEGRAVLNGRLNAKGNAPSGTASLALENVDLGHMLTGFGYANLGNVDGRLSVQLQYQALLAADSKLQYWDQDQDTAVTLELRSEQTDEGAPAMAATLNGNLRGQPVSGEYFSGPLVSLAVRDEPIPLRAKLQLADTQLKVNGTVSQPIQQLGADLKVSASGPGTDTLSQLIPVNLPEIPAYDVSGNLLRDDDSWYVREIDATVGSSDISGDVRWQMPAEGRPMIWATLHSDELRSDDFLASGEPESSAKPSEDETEQNSGGSDVLPEGEVFRRYLQALNAEVEYKAQKLNLAGVALDETHLDLTLNDGRLTLRPLSVGVASGAVELQLDLNAQSLPAEGDAQIELARVKIQDLLENFDVVDETLGIVGGRGKFSFSGNSLADAMAALNGNMRLMMSGGQINALVVEAIGLDASEMLFGLIGDEPEPVDIQCAYVELDADQGLVDLKHFTVATTDSNIRGNGNINMKKEEFELALEADPKDASLLSGSSPIELSGTFTNLEIDVVSQELLGKGALAVAAAAAFPAAALAPLVETGTESGTGGCNDLVASAEE